jgi:hypothetical protein
MALDIIGHINQEAVNLTTQQKLKMLDDYASYFGYSDTLEDGDGNTIPNPETKKEFANRMIEKHIRDIVKSVRKRRAEAQVTYEELEL